MPDQWERLAAPTAAPKADPWSALSREDPWSKLAARPSRPGDTYEEQLTDLGLTAAQVESAQAAAETPGDRDYIKQLADLGLTEEDATAAQAQHEAALDAFLNSDRMEEWKPSKRWLLRHSQFVERLIGPGQDMRKTQIGGAPVSPGEAAAALLQMTTAPPPIANAIRNVSEPVIKALPGKATRGISRGVRETLLGFPLAVPGGPAALAAFGAQYIWELAEQKAAYDKAVAAGDTEEAFQIATQTAAGGGLLALAGAHGPLKGVAEARDFAAEPPAAPVDPDLVARNLASPGTMRPQEVRGAVAAEAEAPAQIFQASRAMEDLIPNTTPEPAPPAAEFFVRRPIRNVAGDVTDVQIVPVERGTVREDPGGGQISFAAEAPTLNREAISPREEPAKTTEPRGLIAGTTAEAWADRVINQDPRTRTQALLDPQAEAERIAAWTIKGAALIERGVRKFEEWSARMIAEHGDVIRPDLRSLFEQSQRAAAAVAGDQQGESVRKFAGRAAVSRQVPPAMREQIRRDPAIRYDPQNVGDVTRAVAEMTNNELAGMPVIRPDGNNNAYVAGQLELFRRRLAAGAPEEAYQTLDGLWRLGTSLGQLVNQFKLLKGASPEGVVAILNRRQVKNKERILSPVETTRVMASAETATTATAAREAAEKTWMENPSDTNWKAIENASADEVRTARKLQQLIHVLQPKSFFDMLISVEQGNVLQPRSQLTNIAENMINLFMGWQRRPVAAFFDVLDATVRQRPREITIAPTRTTPAAARGFARALREAGAIAVHGTSNESAVKAEGTRSLHPLLAFKEAIAGNLKDRSVSHRLITWLEASPLTWAPNLFLRGLGAGDVLTRMPVLARLQAEQLQLNTKNARRELGRFPRRTLDFETALRMDQLRRQSSFTAADVHRAAIAPELYFTPKEIARMETESRTAVFQDQTYLNQLIGQGLSALRDWSPLTHFALRSAALFIQTPLNVFRNLFRYTPLNLVNAAKQAAAGNGRAAKFAVADALIGSVWLTLGYALARRGIVTPGLDQPGEQQKERALLEMTGMPPNSLNLSAIDRWRRGQPTAWQPGDRTINILRLGVPGALMANSAAVSRAQERQPDAPNAWQTLGQAMPDIVATTANYGLNQSMLSGVNSALKAVQQGGAMVDAWMKQYADTLLSIPLPNTLKAASQASREFKPELRGDTRLDTLNNIIKDRLDVGFKGTKDLPLRRDLWGRPIPETPAGARPWLFQMMDVTQGREVPDDTVNLTLYGLWRETADNNIIPTPPDGNLTLFRTSYQLTREQTSRLQEMVGINRRRLAETVVERPQFLMAPNEVKVAILKQIWEAGAQVGRAQFISERRSELKPREKPAGLP
jgi:uncharacterized protein YjiS (DUF1127 family)